MRAVASLARHPQPLREDIPRIGIGPSSSINPWKRELCCDEPTDETKHPCSKKKASRDRTDRIEEEVSTCRFAY